MSRASSPTRNTAQGDGMVINPADKPPVVSSQVDWYTVHLYAKPLLESVGSWPMVGTPGWRYLDDDDPAKLAAVYDASRYWALRVATSQEAMAEASRAISNAADWKAVANRLVNQSSVYIHRLKETM
jgi:hypothetical protein